MSGILRELLARHRTLAIFGFAMALAMLPALLALALDGRELRGVSVWVKPLKFMAATSLFALTLAWFTGLVDPARRHHRALQWMAGLAMGTAFAEVAYITLQAALGQGSHYNFSDPLHIALYSAMGFGAMVLTATQLILAWAIWRHPRPGLHPVWRAAVLAGLVLGGLLGSMQPPAGAGLPLVGWHLGGGDLRPAHFLGLHATQLLPLAALALLALPVRRGLVLLALGSGAYTLLWAAALALGLQGAVLTVPYAA
jgi:hypothetical protein